VRDPRLNFTNFKNKSASEIGTTVVNISEFVTNSTRVVYFNSVSFALEIQKLGVYRGGIYWAAELVVMVT